jgi:hypothetical protein
MERSGWEKQRQAGEIATLELPSWKEKPLTGKMLHYGLG